MNPNSQELSGERIAEVPQSQPRPNDQPIGFRLEVLIMMAIQHRRIYVQFQTIYNCLFFLMIVCFVILSATDPRVEQLIISFLLLFSLFLKIASTKTKIKSVDQMLSNLTGQTILDYQFTINFSLRFFHALYLISGASVVVCAIQSVLGVANPNLNIVSVSIWIITMINYFKEFYPYTRRLWCTCPSVKLIDPEQDLNLSNLNRSFPTQYYFKNGQLYDHRNRPLDSALYISDEQCSICLENYANGAGISLFNCRHFFHYDCVLPWIWRNNECQLCRYHV